MNTTIVNPQRRALPPVKMLLSNTAVPIFGNSYEAAFRIRQRRRDIEGHRAERFPRSDTTGSNTRWVLGAGLVYGAVS